MRCCALTGLCADGVCADGLVWSVVDLSLVLEYRCGRGGLCVGVNQGSVGIVRLRGGVAGLARRWVGDRIVLAADVWLWRCPDAQTSLLRLFAHVCGRAEGGAWMIPGWPY